LRDRHGVAYTASASVIRRRRARALLICATVDPGRGALALKAFRDTLAEARRTGPADAALARARAVRAGALEASFDDLWSATHAWTRALSLGKPAPTVDAERGALEEVTAAEVQELAQKVLEAGSLRWVLSGDRRAIEAAARESGLGRVRRLTPAR
jgi:predicted Zn-dependent peptidase